RGLPSSTPAPFGAREGQAMWRRPDAKASTRDLGPRSRAVEACGKPDVLARRGGRGASKSGRSAANLAPSPETACTPSRTCFKASQACRGPACPRCVLARAMTGYNNDPSRTTFSTSTIDLAIRLGFLCLVGYWSLKVIAPFLTILLWSAILTVALYPVFDW